MNVEEHDHQFENPIAGHPWVIVVIDPERYSVRVSGHAESFDVVCRAVDMMPVDTILTCSVEMIRSEDLVDYLVYHRKQQAQRMEAAFQLT